MDQSKLWVPNLEKKKRSWGRLLKTFVGDYVSFQLLERRRRRGLTIFRKRGGKKRN